MRYSWEPRMGMPLRPQSLTHYCKRCGLRAGVKYWFREVVSWLWHKTLYRYWTTDDDPTWREGNVVWFRRTFRWQRRPPSFECSKYWVSCAGEHPWD